jgi:hypothetical protein
MQTVNGSEKILREVCKVVAVRRRIETRLNEP